MNNNLCIKSPLSLSISSLFNLFRSNIFPSTFLASLSFWSSPCAAHSEAHFSYLLWSLSNKKSSTCKSILSNLVKLLRTNLVPKREAFEIDFHLKSGDPDQDEAKNYLLVNSAPRKKLREDTDVDQKVIFQVFQGSSNSGFDFLLLNPISELGDHKKGKIKLKTILDLAFFLSLLICGLALVFTSGSDTSAGLLTGELLFNGGFVPFLLALYAVFTSATLFFRLNLIKAGFSLTLLLLGIGFLVFAEELSAADFQEMVGIIIFEIGSLFFIGQFFFIAEDAEMRIQR